VSSSQHPSNASKAPALSIVIPAYNEERHIERTLAHTQEYLRARALPSEVVISDDGSRDGTAQLVRAWQARDEEPPVRLVSLPMNRGKGAALKAGVLATRGRRVLMMDADLATPLKELEVLERAMDSTGAAIACGSRAVRSANITHSQSSLRVLFGSAGNLWIRSLALPGMLDTQCGFKLFEGELARELFALAKEDRFAIDVEILCLAQYRFQAEMVEVGVEWAHQQGSTVRWRDYLDVLLSVPRIRIVVELGRFLRP
jgi:glycosyltransferase involved in cell wall biosynthesis